MDLRKTTMSLVLLGVLIGLAGADIHRSPVDVAVSPDGAWLVTANQTASTVSLVRLADGEVVDEQPAGKYPTAIEFSPNGQQVLVTARDSGELVRLAIVDNKLKTLPPVEIGMHPCGVAVSPDGSKAYVARTVAGDLAIVDLSSGKVVSHIKVGTWPRYPAVSLDGSRLAVGVSGDRGVAVVDCKTEEVVYLEEFRGSNIGHLVTSRDGRHVYFPWMIYRKLAITQENIRLGWVWASRLGRLRLDEEKRREAVSLDPRGRAIADPFGIGLTADEQTLICTASGTQELLIYDMASLPWEDRGGTDHIHPRLLSSKERFDRIDLGGRPMGMVVGPSPSGRGGGEGPKRTADAPHPGPLPEGEGTRVYIANYLLDAVQIVDINSRKIVKTIDLGNPPEISLARRGEAIFFDGKRSLDQWYSCHTCHQDGGTNSLTIDTHNDGTTLSFKTVTSLWNVHDTSPWTWHGWQEDLPAAMEKSITSTMLGKKPSEDDVDALIAYLKTVKPPTNPHRLPDGSLTAAAKQGEKVFHSNTAGCATCHNGPHYTDGEIHDVGLGRKRDAYDGYNTPSLIGVYTKTHLLHDGRARSLEETLTGAHAPEKVTGQGKLTEEELLDLVEFLRSL